MRTILRLVVPRTIESSTRMTRLPSRMLRTGLSFTRTPKWRIDCCGWMNVRPDVVVADEPHPHRDAALLGEADGGADARVGNRHDDVGLDRGLTRQRPAEVRADLVDAPAEDVAVGPREVDVLEHAVRQPLLAETACTTSARSR